MTLDQITGRILTAADAQDLAALQAANELRDDAIAGLDSVPPTPELYQQVLASLAAGEKARQALKLMKQRIRNESRQLTQIEDGFVRGLRQAQRHQVDCKG